MSTQPAERIIARASAVLQPKGGDHIVKVPPPKPCVVILVHGVNDLAGFYARVEEGLCAGLNERLDLNEGSEDNPGRLRPASYTLPTGDADARNPDAVYYRRKNPEAEEGRTARSVVIPFYWGYREEDAKINKTEPHGEWLDRHGNRLDKDGTIEGGPFVNATTTLPDMWGDGATGLLFGQVPMGLLTGGSPHPVYPGPPRRYQVLAAMRLAMLVKIIRKRYPEDTINIVAHSQGTMLTLLAQAFLADEAAPVQPADCVVLMNSCYSLHEPVMEKKDRTGGDLMQQTTRARISTLRQVVDFVAARAVTTPPLSSLSRSGKPGYGAIGGARWTGGSACKASIDGREVSFDERDNRGATYLYFTPHDQTVALDSVRGIGWQGVGDTVNGEPAFGVMNQRFYQRIFTLLKRDQQREKVGSRPLLDRYVLRMEGEDPWQGTGLGVFGVNVMRGSFAVGQSVQLRGAPLPVPVEVRFDYNGVVTDEKGQVTTHDTASGIYQVRAPHDPISASVLLSNGGYEPHNLQWARTEMIANDDRSRHGNHWSKHEQLHNEGKSIEDRARVLSVRNQGNGVREVTRGETPYEARLRLQKLAVAKQECLSFHSEIPGNPLHSRKVLAYDLAVGSGKSVDDVAFYEYLCRVADWRLPWPQKDLTLQSGTNAYCDHCPSSTSLAFLSQEDASCRELIDGTVTYRSKLPPNYFSGANGRFWGGGVLPPRVQSAVRPSLVVSETNLARTTLPVLNQLEKLKW